MKKVYLSLISLGLFSAVNAQMKTVEMKGKNQIQTVFQEGPKGSSIEEKAAGDVIWYNTMSNTTNWVASVVGGSQSSNLGWQFSPTNTGGTSVGTWYFVNTKINSTTKTTGYFVAKNGNPSTGGTPAPVANAELLLTFDSVFNLSAYPVVDFAFQQYGARFIENQAVEATVDNGSTWIEIGNNNDFTSLTGSGGSVYTNPSNRLYHVKNAFPQGTDFSAVKFRFRITWPSNSGTNNGIMYGWFVDDIKLIEGEPNDLAISEAYNFTGFLGMQYTKIPSSQTGTVQTAFSAEVKNNGGLDQDAVLTITNTGAVGASAETTIAAFDKDSLSYKYYTIPSTIGTYNYTYTVTSNNNTLGNLSDDVATIPLAVTDVIYANDQYDGTDGSITGSFLGWSTMTGEQEIGTFYEIFKDGSIGAIQVGIGKVNTNSQADYIGRACKANLYSIDTTDFSITNKFSTIEHVITADDFGQLLTLKFDFGQYPVTEGEVYAVTFSSYEDIEVPLMFAGFHTAGNTIGVDGTDQTLFSLAADRPNKVEAPVVRLDFTDYSGVSKLSNNINFSVFPNPTSGNVNVNYTLENNADVTVSVVDVTGKELYSVSETAKAAGKYNTNVETSSFNSGVYYVTVSVNGVKSTSKLIKK